MLNRLIIQTLLAVAIVSMGMRSQAQNPLRFGQQLGERSVDQHGFVNDNSDVKDSARSDRQELLMSLKSNSTDSQRRRQVTSQRTPGFTSNRRMNQSVNEIPPAVHAAVFTQRAPYSADAGREHASVNRKLAAAKTEQTKRRTSMGDTVPRESAAQLLKDEPPSPAEEPINTADLTPVISMLDQLQNPEATAAYQEELDTPAEAIYQTVDYQSPVEDRENQQKLASAENVLASLNQGRRLSQAKAPSNKLPEKAARFGSDGSRVRVLAEKLATNTMIVMVCGIGFILIAKQWMKLKPRKSKPTQAGFEIVARIQVSPKSYLMEVNLGEERLVVATDPSGVKSVIRLTDTFSQTLDSFTDDETEAVNPTGTETRRDHKAARVETLNDRDNSDRYSLATLGKSKPNRQSDQPAKHGKNTITEAEEAAIRIEMEEALAKHGLKNIILQNLKSSG